MQRFRPLHRDAPQRMHAVPILFRDYESKSTCDLRRVGAHVYTRHSTTDVWCCAYAVNDDKVKLWTPGDPIPPEFLEAAQNPDWLVVAHNDAFERAIEAHIMTARYGWPAVPIERHRCTLATARALALPGALDKVAAALSLEHRKDADGHRNMLQMSRPRKPRQDEDPNGTYWLDDPERLARLYAYCLQDVRVERELYSKLPPLSPEEQALWALDQRINDRGFHTDGVLISGALKIADPLARAIDAELAAITGGAVMSIN